MKDEEQMGGWREETEEEGLHCILYSAFPAVVALFSGLLSRTLCRWMEKGSRGSYFGWVAQTGGLSGCRNLHCGLLFSSLFVGVQGGQIIQDEFTHKPLI